jgi:hypothetical protein
MKDCAMQALYLLALLPVAETTPGEVAGIDLSRSKFFKTTERSEFSSYLRRSEEELERLSGLLNP